MSKKKKLEDTDLIETKRVRTVQHGKTVHYIIVYCICLLIAVMTWLFVMYDSEADPNEKTDETAAVSETCAENVCQI